jgi:hypothetical protein
LTINPIESKAATGEKDGLLAWWKFDETDGDRAADASGAGRDGQLKGAPRWITAEGSLGRALEFDGATTYLDCEDAAEFDVGDRFSVAMWIRGCSSDKKETQTLLAKEGAWRLTHTGNEELSFLLSGPRSAGGSPLRNICPNLNCKLSLDQDRWHHAAATYDGKRTVLYINGEAQSSIEASGPISLSTAPVNLGGSNSGAGFFKGAMADVRVYGRGLAADEVKALYSAGRQ